MSNFWQKALGGTPAAPSPAPAAGGPWWNQPLLPPSAPPTTEQQYVTSPPQQVPTAPPSKAQSARVTEYCPECGSDNYFKPVGLNAMYQCYNCGFNPRFGTQSGATGMPSSDSGPATPARQVASAHTGYSGAIVGKA